MFAISLWQPWATLIADHRKPHETRSWPPPQRLMGRDIAIHASKRFQQDERILAKQWGYDPGTMPLGAIVAVVRLSSCMRTELFSTPPYDVEYGDFTPGRWAWRLENVRRLRKPIPVAGHQGFFVLAPQIERQLDEIFGPRHVPVQERLDTIRPGDRLSQQELRELMRAPR